MTTEGKTEEKFVPDQPLSPRGQVIALLFLATAIAIGLLWYFYFSPLPRDLRACDQAIKERLRAPSTYRRISAPTFHSERGSYWMTYEAQNSFGVPLQSKGFCSVGADGAAVWSEV